MANLDNVDATSIAAAADGTAAPAATAAVAPSPPPESTASPALPPPPPPKQTRGSLTLREKWAVKSFCEQRVGECRARSEPPPSQEVLRAEVFAKFGWALGRSTLSRVLLADWKALAATRNASMKRRRLPLFPAFEAELVHFVAARLAQLDGPTGAATDGKTRVLTEALILEEAQRLKHVHGIKNEQLVLSVGWLARFKHRNGIRLRKNGGAGAKADLAVPAPSQDAGMPLATAHAHFSLNGGLVVDDKAYFVDQNSVAAPGFLPGPQLHGMDAQTASLLHHHAEADAALKHVAPPHPPLDVDAEAASIYDTRLPTVSEMTRSTLCRVYESQFPVRSAALQRTTAHIPSAIRALACACERTLPLDIDGLNVVVLGRDSVAEAFAVAALVGRHGVVTCVDSVLANVLIGQQHAESYALALGYPAANVRFVHGLTPPTDAADGTVPDAVAVDSLIGHAASDLVLLNCSFHTVPTASERANVLTFAYNLLHDGGELRVSTVCCSRRLSPAFCSAHQSSVTTIRKPESAAIATGSDDIRMDGASESADGTSLSEAVTELLRSVYLGDFTRLCRRVGFSALRQLEERTVDCAALGADNLATASGGAKFVTVAFRLFKVPPSADDCAEDYGQYAVFNGVGATSSDSEEGASESALEVYRLDRDFCFERGVHVRVDGNTAQLLQTSWLKRFFTVVGDQSTHLGLFEAASEMV